MPLGEYLGQGALGAGTSIQPEYAPIGNDAPYAGQPAGSYFPMTPGGEVSGLGAHVGGGGTAWKLAATYSPAAKSLGQAADVLNDRRVGAVTGVAAGATVVAILLGVGLRMGAGYAAGKAMAPSPAKESKYAWGTAFGSLFLGTLGIGGAGLIALNSKS